MTVWYVPSEEHAGYVSVIRIPYAMHGTGDCSLAAVAVNGRTGNGKYLSAACAVVTVDGTFADELGDRCRGYVVNVGHVGKKTIRLEVFHTERAKFFFVYTKTVYGLVIEENLAVTVTEEQMFVCGIVLLKVGVKLTCGAAHVPRQAGYAVVAVKIYVMGRSMIGRKEEEVLPPSHFLIKEFEECGQVTV